MRLFLIQTLGIVLILASLTSCKTRSKFTSNSISIGMTKEQVVSKFGQPYKSGFTENKETGEIKETLYYRENLWIAGNNSITNILVFKDGKLVSLEQGQEANTSSPTILTQHP